MMGTLQFAPAPIIRGFSPTEDFAFALAAVQTSTGGGAASTVRDMNAVAAAATNNTFAVNLQDSIQYPGTVIRNLTPAIVTVPGDGKAFPPSTPSTIVAPGLAQVRASNPVLGTRVLSFAVSQVGGGSAFSSYIAGSLASQLQGMVDGALAGVAAGFASCAMRLSYGANQINPALWCKGIVDVTALSRDDGHGYFHKCLISPRHVILANHMNSGNQLIGQTFVWTDNAGNAYGGTIAAIAQVGITDIAIGYVRDATAAELASYPLNPPSLALSAAGITMSAASPIKPMAFLPANVWAAAGAVSLPLVNSVSNWVPVPLMESCGAAGPPGGIASCVGVWDLVNAPVSQSFGGETSSCDQIAQSALALRAPFSNQANIGSTQSGGCSFTAIPAGSSMAAAAASNGQVLGAKWPIVVGLNWLGIPGANTSFSTPWTPAYLAQITAAMQSTAQAAGDPQFATYAAVTVPTAAYPTY